MSHARFPPKVAALALTALLVSLIVLDRTGNRTRSPRGPHTSFGARPWDHGKRNRSRGEADEIAGISSRKTQTTREEAPKISRKRIPSGEFEAETFLEKPEPRPGLSVQSHRGDSLSPMKLEHQDGFEKQAAEIVNRTLGERMKSEHAQDCFGKYLRGRIYEVRCLVSPAEYLFEVDLERQTIQGINLRSRKILKE